VTAKLMPAHFRNFLPVIVLLCVVATAAWWVFRSYFDTYHLVTVQNGVLYRDGVKTIRQFDLAARRTHVKTVVSLVDDREINQPPFAEEMAYCKDHGIDVVRVPVTLGGWPSGDQVQKFLAVATDPARQPILVHCAQGVRRTGMMVAAYEMTVLKYNQQQALDAMLTFGHSQRTVADVKFFIQSYDPQTERMTATDLPQSNE
jgi:protein tyrosine/serine phosphatase